LVTDTYRDFPFPGFSAKKDHARRDVNCKQSLKNETEQSGPKREYVLNQPKSGTLFWLICFTAAGVESNRWLPQIV
jgi:hypothetical protein